MNHLIKLTEYNLWANTKVCNEFLVSCSERELDMEVPSSFFSLRKTVYHIWDAERIWLNRMTAGELTVLPIVHEPLSLSQFSEKIISHSKKFAAFVKEKDQAFFSGTIAYKNSTGKEFVTGIEDVIVHCMNHSTYHRGQLVTMLHTLGIKTASSTDYITYLRVGA